ncbi:hypothetical protein U1Q18_001974 [Sarracenia purpurea var. burkii]
MVGCDKEAETLVERLKAGMSELEIVSIIEMGDLDHLVKLKLLNDMYPHPPSNVILPQLYNFPPNLKKLALADTLLDWEHMSILGILPKLEVLKLKNKVFMGQRWKAFDGGFHLLKFLLYGKTDLVHWEASSHHFP